MQHMDKFKDHIAEVMAEAITSIQFMDEGQMDRAVSLIREYKRVIICSMGKPAFACAKAVFTAHSFGLDWVELDATHSFHGDIGIVKEGDLIIIVSKSGETKETNEVAKYLDESGYTQLAITSGENSTLSNLCEFTLNIPLENECSPFGMAPMASTTLYMIVLHALLTEAVDAHGCTIEQYARNHTAGEIGERLKTELDGIKQ